MYTSRHRSGGITILYTVPLGRTWVCRGGYHLTVADEKIEAVSDIMM